MNRDIEKRLRNLEYMSCANDDRPKVIWLASVKRNEAGELVEIARKKIPVVPQRPRARKDKVKT